MGAKPASGLSGRNHDWGYEVFRAFLVKNAPKGAMFLQLL
jgi:hypothetical protein